MDHSYLKNPLRNGTRQRSSDPGLHGSPHRIAVSKQPLLPQ